MGNGPSTLRVGRTWALAGLAWVAALATCAAAYAGATLRTDSLAPYVHRLNLYDDEGKAINPKDEGAKPYSPMVTCGKCHPYATIGSGWHFNANEAKVAKGRYGEPWILTDQKTGTQILLSYRGWEGTYRPADLGISEWQFVQMFGRHVPGGGVGEPSEAERDKSAEKMRWGISGAMRNDCMACHSAEGTYDFNLRWTQISEGQNLRWAPTAAAGLAVIVGNAKAVPDDFDPEMPADPDHPERAGPKVVYDKGRFDADDRVLFRIVRKPSARQCYACHMTRQAGEQIWEHDGDVHLKKGMTCVDCHRHGVDHAMARGVEGEASALSCRGCHLGEGGAAGGRMGAPVPRHAGLPPLHLEKMSCTACHSGPKPTRGSVGRVQTAMGHQLGLATRERTEESPPYVVGPVFARGEDGKIAPFRMVWPAYWGYLKDGKVKPLLPAEVVEAAGSALGDEMDPEHAEGVREKLEAAAKGRGEAVYVAGGMVWRRSEGGILVNPLRRFTASYPYQWAIGHDVRPKGQALGAGGCTDCHSDGSAMMFGKVVAGGPVKRGTEPVLFPWQYQCEYAGLAWAYESFFDRSFVMRPYLKGVGFASSALVLAVLLLYGFRGLERVLRGGRRGTGVT